MHIVTTTIERRWLADIVAKRKLIEYRDIKPYWTKRLEGIGKPFLLRLINGMQPNAPEVTVIVTRVRRKRPRKANGATTREPPRPLPPTYGAKDRRILR